MLFTTKLILTTLLPLWLTGCSLSSAKNEKEMEPSIDSATTTTRTSADHTEKKEDDCILSQTVYTPEDSAKVVALLKMDTGKNDVLFYARQFKGIPYVAATLEIKDPEQLIVNLRQLDCTTLVETVVALTLTKRQGSTSFARYCRNLESLRYRGGKMDGYLSRLHYFSWWMHDNMDKGLIHEVQLPNQLTSVINVQNHYMTRHPDKYKFLVAHPEWVDSLRTMEEQSNGPDGRYLPERHTALKHDKLAEIQDGDIVAIVTTKDGIDYSHLGFAVWGKDGYLHLLNASSVHHKVVEEPKTLYRYLQERKTSIGIRLWRLR